MFEDILMIAIGAIGTIVIMIVGLMVFSKLSYWVIEQKSKRSSALKKVNPEESGYFANHCMDCGKEINPTEVVFVSEFDAYMCEDCVHRIETMLDPDPESEIIQNELRSRRNLKFPKQLKWYRIHIQIENTLLEPIYQKEEQLIQAVDDLHAMKFASDFLIYRNVISVTVFTTRLTQPGEDGETVEKQIYHEKGKANR